MVEVKEAVKIAILYMNDLYDAAEVENLLLEEVELSEDEKHWLVTLSFKRQIEKLSELAYAMNHLTPEKEIRAYKVIKINTNDGQVESMKIRQL